MRLTIKDKEIRNSFNAEYAKLADLEDIEEELGIDLLILFKALKNGVTNYNGGSKWYVALAYDKIRDEYYLYYNFGGGYSKTRDYDIEYGWALTKEELEK